MKEKNRNMVAISLYRGNLHRTPDLPRRWLMPNPKISLKDFKSLLARRSKALSRSSNPNPNPLSSATNRKQLQLSNQPPELVDSNKPLHGSDFENHAFEKPSHAAATSIEKHTHPVSFPFSYILLDNFNFHIVSSIVFRARLLEMWICIMIKTKGKKKLRPSYKF